MTTGLQTAEGTATWSRSLRTRLEAAFRHMASTPARLAGTLRVHDRGTHASIAPPRSSGDVRRGARAATSARARDVHDRAVLRGVFPPRL